MKQTILAVIAAVLLGINTNCANFFTKQNDNCISKNNWSYRPQKEMTKLDKAKNKLYYANLAVSESYCDHVVYIKSSNQQWKRNKSNILLFLHTYKT